MIRSLHAAHTLDDSAVRAFFTPTGFVGTTTSFVFGLTGLKKNTTYTCQLFLGTVVQTITSASYSGSAATVTSSNNRILVSVPAGTGTASVSGITLTSPVVTSGKYSLKIAPPTGSSKTITLYYDTAFGWSLTLPKTVTGNERITGSLVVNGSVVSVQDIIIGGRSILQIING
jgi:hypothetical protein